MTITNNPKSTGDSATFDQGVDSATGNQVPKIVLTEPAGGTFITPALESGGNLASIKTNTAITAAGTAATSGLPIQGMVGGVPVPVSGTFWPTTQPVSGTFWQATQPVSIASMPSTPVTGTFWQATQPVSGTFWPATQPVSAASLPLPTGAAQDGTDGTGITPPAGAVGIRGWLSGIFNKLNTTIGVTGTFWQATQPVSAASLPLPAGAATAANQPTAAAQGSATSGQTGRLIEGAVTTAAPTYTTGQTNPLSLDTAGNLRVSVTTGGASGNVAQGSTTASNTGPMAQGAVTTAAPTYTTGQTDPLSLNTSGGLRVDGSGVTQPVSLASQPLPTGASTAAKQPALGTAGAAAADVITVQGVASMTPVKTDGSGVTQPVSAASLPLPAGAATAVGLTAVVTALGTPMQATGGTVTANAGTNLNTSALALETGGNLASIKTNTAITAAGTTAASGSPVQGMTGGVPLPVSVAALPLPAGAAQDGTDGTGIVQPTGGVGIRGWLSGIYSKLVSPVLPANAAQETGGNLAAILTAATGSIPAGSAIIGKVGIDPSTNAVVASAGTNLNTSALALESGGNLAAILATRTVTPASTNSVTTSAAAIAAHISAVAGQYGYLSGIMISGLGATATSAIACTITGLIGGTRTFWIQIPAGVAVALNPIQLSFKPAIQSSAVNTLIQVNIPSFGTGNVEASVIMDGYTSASAFPL